MASLRDVAQHAGVSVATASRVVSGFDGVRSETRDRVERAMRELLARAPRPTGVICSSDLMAIGALQEAAAQGLHVPRDLSIVGFDGIEATAWTNPALTTVEQPIEEIAETAVNALRTRMDEPTKPLPDSFFRPRLRKRA